MASHRHASLCLDEPASRIELTQVLCLSLLIYIARFSNPQHACVCVCLIAADANSQASCEAMSLK